MLRLLYEYLYYSMSLLKLAKMQSNWKLYELIILKKSLILFQNFIFIFCSAWWRSLLCGFKNYGVHHPLKDLLVFDLAHCQFHISICL